MILPVEFTEEVVEEVPVRERTGVPQPVGRVLCRNRVLMATADSEWSRQLREHLVGMGLPVTLIPDGMAALCRLCLNPGEFGLVIVDRSLPELDAFEFLREVRCYAFSIKTILRTPSLTEDDWIAYGDLAFDHLAFDSASASDLKWTVVALLKQLHLDEEVWRKRAGACDGSASPELGGSGTLSALERFIYGGRLAA